jgi:hypothetical protein
MSILSRILLCVELKTKNEQLDVVISSSIGLESPSRGVADRSRLLKSA